MAMSSKVTDFPKEKVIDYVLLGSNSEHPMSDSSLPNIGISSISDLEHSFMKQDYWTTNRKYFIAGALLGVVLSLALLAVIKGLRWCQRSSSDVETIGRQNIQGPQVNRDQGAIEPAASNDEFTAIAYNVTPPLGPPEDEDESEFEADDAQTWSNGLVTTPEAHPRLL